MKLLDISLYEGIAFCRSDWGYSKDAYLKVEMCNNILNVYIYNQYSNVGSDVPIGYGFTYLDIISDRWYVV